MSEEKNVVKKQKPKDETANQEVKPVTKSYTKEEIDEISKKVETPTDQTPIYTPKHILSPEFGGASNYEEGINRVRKETRAKLECMKNESDTNLQQIKQIEEELKILDNLYENYNLGMNVFRTAKGGRDKLRINSD